MNIMDARLKEILLTNKDTDFGKKYDFEHICSNKEYADKVPLAKIDDFNIYVNLATRLGECNIIAKDDVIAYCDTLSDDAEHSFLVPCTKDHIKDLVNYYNSLIEDNFSFFLFESENGKRRYADKAVYNSFAGVALSEMAKTTFKKSPFHFLKKDMTDLPIELIIENEFADNIKLRLLFALLCKDLTQIIAISSFNILKMFRALEDNWKELVNIIRNGEITKNVISDEQTRAKCNSYFSSDSARADELEKIFEAGFDEPVAIKIWPKLRRIICNGYGVYKIYTENCKRYTQGINFNNSYLGDSVAIIGFAPENTNNSFVIDKNNSYIEFLPLESKDNQTVTLEEVKLGQQYEVVITNNAGLYRVRTNIVVRIKKIFNDQIIVNYCYYIPETYSFENEKIYETNLSQALILLINGSNIAIEDFAFDIDNSNRRVNVYLEPNLYAKSKVALESIKPEILNSLMDSALQIANTKYAEARLAGKINPCYVYLLESETQLLCYDKMKYISNKNVDAFKPIHYLLNERCRNLFLPFIKKN